MHGTRPWRLGTSPSADSEAARRRRAASALRPLLRDFSPSASGDQQEGVMSRFHELEGFVIVAGWGLLFLWGIGLFLFRREADRLYWGLVAVLQVLLGIQLLAGTVLLVMGDRRPVLHYLYGAVLPAITLVVCHVLTRSLQKPPYHLFFTWGALFIFGLTARALMTGLGTG